MSKNKKCIKEIIIWILKCIVAFVISLGILSLVGLVYQHSGVHITNPSGATDYKWEPYQYKSTMVENYSWIKMDEHGFNNAYAVKKDTIDILLMGSSHMEAVEVAADKNVGYLLNEKLDEKYTYNVGTSGHTLYTCVKNMEAAVKEYSPQEYVMVETDRLELDIDEMHKVLQREYKTIPSYDKGLMYVLQKSVPSIKNLYNQLDLWRKVDVDYEDSKDDIAEAEESIIDDSYDEVLSDFLDMANVPVRMSGATLVIFYQPPTQIDKNGVLKNSTNENLQKVFEELCREKNIVFIDMTEAFETLYRKHNKLAHGFYNTAVGVGHLNEDGHRVIAEKLADYISKEQKGY